MLLRSYLTNSLPTLTKGLIGILFLRLFVEYFGKEGLGQIAQMQAFVALIFAIINGVFFNYVVSSAWDNKNQKETSFSDVLVLIFLLSTIAGIILFSVKNIISNLLINNRDLSYEITILSIMCPIIGVYTAMSGRLCSEGYLTQYNILNTFGIIISGLIILFSIQNYGINGAFIGIALFYLSPAIIIYFAYHKLIKKKISKAKLNLLMIFPYKTLLTFSFIGLYMVVSAIFLKIIVRDDIYRAFGWGEVGNWEVINKISETYLLLTTAPLANYMMPILSKNQDEDLKQELIKKILLIGIAFIIFASVSTYLLWNSIVVKIIGMQFLELRSYILIQQMGDVFKIINWTLCIVALVCKKYKFVLICEVLWTIIYYTLLNLLIKPAGLQGTLYAYLISNFILALILLYDYYKNNK